MRKTIVGVLVMLFAFCAFSQTTSQMSTIVDMQAEISALQTKLSAAQRDAAKPVSKFAGLGEEVGTIMRELVKTVDSTAEVTIERVDQFSNTRVGKFTMILVGWKVIVKDLSSTIFNKIIGIILLFISIHILNKGREIFLTGKMVLTERERIGWRIKRTYKRSLPLHEQKIDSSIYGGWIAIYVISTAVVFLAAVVGLCH